MPFNNIESTKWNSAENDDGMFLLFVNFFFPCYYFFVIQSISVFTISTIEVVQI